MAKFLILHGTNGSPNENWFMWLKGVLIGQGHVVWLPQLPHSEKPNTETYNEFLLANKNFAFDEDTLIIGHSSGAVAALHLLQHLPMHSTVRAAILISAFKDNLNWDALDGLFIEPLDFDLIKKHCQSFTFIHSDNDPYCPLSHAEYLAGQAGGRLIVMEGQGHFNTELGPQYRRFTPILDIIQDSLKGTISAA